MKEDRVYLEHVLEAAGKIAAYTAGGWEAFAGNPMAQDAVIRNFEIIGEAVKRLGEQTKSLHPGIPWREIAGLRDVLIHNYMGVNLRHVWNVIQQNLPGLRNAVEDLLKGG